MQSEYKIAIPKDDKGYTHRFCPSCHCKFGIRWFGELPNNLHCPYCEMTGNVKDFNISAQLDYAVAEGMHQIASDLQATFRQSGMNFKPAPQYRMPAPLPRQVEIPTDMECSACEGQYEIYGIASQCPYCDNEDIKLVDANLTTIEKEIMSTRALRQTYNDVVIAFQNECRFFAQNEGKKPNFQNINAAEAYFRNTFTMELLADIDDQSLLALRTVFEKRHAEQHNSGFYDERSVANLGLDENHVGYQVTYSKDELSSAFKALVVISKNLRSRIT